MPSHAINPSLKHMADFKGDDGLKEAECAAYATCQKLSCRHEACYKRYMYSPPGKQKEQCAPLMDEWKACFAAEMAKRSKAAVAEPQPRTA